MHYQEQEAALYDRIYAGVKHDIPYWQTIARDYCGAQGKALELACGTLRVTLPLAEAGYHVTGIDESEFMLKLGREKLAHAPQPVRERVRLVQGDMRAYDLPERFNLIYIPFNTLGLLLTTADQLAALDCAKRHLAPGGVFALDVYVPDVERLVAATANHWFLEKGESFEDGVELQRDLSRENDTRRQITHITWRTKEYRNNLLEREWLSHLEMSYFFPRELEHLLARAGFELTHYWGNYQREDFWSLSEPWRQLVIARPA